MFNKLSRDTSLRIHYILDQWVPPFIRDCRWIMSIPLWFVFRHRYKSYLDFKEVAYGLSEEEFRGYYHTVSDTAIERETDLNKASVIKIMQHVTGPKVLDVGCQNGFIWLSTNSVAWAKNSLLSFRGNAHINILLTCT